MKVGYQIYHLSVMMKKKIDEMYGKEAFTGRQGRLLHFILSQPESRDLFQKDIEFEFQIKKSTATELLQELEKKEYIKRVPTANDARLKKIIPLSKAESIRNKAMKDMEVLEQQLLKGINESQQEVFLDVLKKIQQNLR